MNVLICPDKFKGTLTAEAVAEAMAVGWKKSRPRDHVTLLPVSDGGDGFGAIMATMLRARPIKLKTVNAAHEPIESFWWWEPKSKTAIIESAGIIGLAMLPRGKFHPYDLNTFGLGAALLAAAKKGASKAIIGIGGSATNDAGFGFARALGWRFYDRGGGEVVEWLKLSKLARITRPEGRPLIPSIAVAVDVKNPLLGAKGCSRIYGPQKGLRPQDMKPAEAALRRLANVLQKEFGLGDVHEPGVGAAGGLGFGLRVFAGAKLQSGFDLVARHASLRKLIRQSDLVITGEGALDHQTLMGKGVGEIALLCRRAKKPCIGLAGFVEDPKRAARLFSRTGALVDLTDQEAAMQKPAKWLKQLAGQVAKAF
ncbi:glycerate kinase [bacterium]|nr:glycerate kinase [bacterium]